MARSLNDKGREELDALLKRVNRQHALRRITTEDQRKLVDKINELDALIIQTNEVNPDDKESFSV